MPIYEYRCRNCGAAFELLVTRADDKPFCPKCASEELERLLSSFGTGGEGSSRRSTSGGCSGKGGGFFT